MKKHGTKVHMGGGDFNVIRDPWRHHSLFAGLFHPHEMPGHGHLPVDQFHQHFTYIANERAINHHTYQHNMHVEGNSDDHGGHNNNDHGGHDKRQYFPNSAVKLSVPAQTKHEISVHPGGPDVITIPLSKIPGFVEERTASKIPGVVEERTASNIPGVVEERTTSKTRVVMAENKDNQSERHDKQRKLKEEEPNPAAPHFQPLGDNNHGPKPPGTVLEIPLAPIVFKRQLTNFKNTVGLKYIVKRGAEKITRPISKINRLRRAFLGRKLISKSN